MSTPANLYPGLNDLSDIFEEIPVEITKYLTLLHEIDAKCTNLLPTLTGSIDKLLNNNNNDNSDKPTLMEINTLLEELMPSLEEKMHVSSLMCELINKLDKRLELAYEVAIRNEEIPSSVRMGLDNHPAMHLHHELIQSLNNPPHSQRYTRSTQNTRNESKRETQSTNSNNNNSNSNNTTNSNRKEKQSSSQENNKKGTANNSSSSSSNTTHNNNNNSNNNNNNNNNGGGAGSASTTTSSKRRSNNSNNSNQSNGNSNANSSTSKQQKGSSKNNSKSTNHTTTTPTPRVNEYGEPVYCYCNQVAYGEMVGCDGENCELEWFHLPCIGLTTLPKGKWYCDTCKARLRRSN